MLSNSPSMDSVHDTLEHACALLRRQLTGGQDCCAEDLLSSFPDLASNQEAALQLVCAEFSIRKELGQNPDPAEWYERFPQWRPQIMERLQDDSTADLHLTSGVATAGESSATTAMHESMPEPRPSNQPRKLGRYEVLEEVGHGGMGVVYRAWDSALHREIALKTIRAGLFADAEQVERFRREAQAAAQLDHPNILRILDVGEQDGQDYYTMAFAEGGSLGERAAGFREPAAAAQLIEKLARAVDYAHGKGIVHRDLKPANVLLDERGEPVISDFGLAKLLDANANADLLTLTGQVLGTPAYMAPEQALAGSGKVGPLSDVWALGVILYELVLGRRPFTGKGPELTEQILSSDPPRPRKLARKLDPGLETVVLKCLQKEPARRYASAAALADDLGRWQRGEAILARPDGWLRQVRRAVGRHPAMSTAAVLLVLASLTAWGLWANRDRFRDADELDHSPPVRQENPSPEQIAKEKFEALQTKLAAGQRVDLIGETGRPDWYIVRSAFNDPNHPFKMQDDFFTVDCLATCLVELVPHHPLDRYKFSVMVRQNDSLQEGMVGLYINHVQRADKGEQHHFLVAQEFVEIGQPNPVRKYQLDVLHFSEQQDGQQANFHRRRLAQKNHQPGKFATWRKLCLEVTPEKIIAKVDDIPQGEATLDRVNQEIKGIGKGYENLGVPQFSPRNSAGLYVSRGQASFKLARIEPLP
jgi:serine/threonine protein kinase